MLHFFGAFVYFLFPLAAVLLYLLIGPMPDMLKVRAQRLADTILYTPVQLGAIALSLFNFIFLVAGATALST
jgi:hypothetical protein